MLLRKVVAGLSNQKLLRPLLHAVLLYISSGGLRRFRQIRPLDSSTKHRSRRISAVIRTESPSLKPCPIPARRHTILIVSTQRDPVILNQSGR